MIPALHAPPAPPAIQGGVVIRGLSSPEAPWARDHARPPFRIPPPRTLALDLTSKPRYWVNPWVDFAALLAFEAVGGGYRAPLPQPPAPTVHAPGTFTWEWHPMGRTILVPRRP